LLAQLRISLESAPGSGLQNGGFKFVTDAPALQRLPQEGATVSPEVSMSTSLGSLLVSAQAREDLQRNLEQLRETLQAHELGRGQVVVSSIALSTGVSVGYVIWLVRGGALLGSMLSAMPMWQMIDPLPVLTRSAGKRADSLEPDDDASVERIFDGTSSEQASSKGALADTDTAQQEARP
jgi:hypothetical protein